MFRAFVSAALARKSAEFEAHIQVIMLPWGGLLGGKKKYTEEEAASLIDDPIQEFPNDVDYLIDKDVRGHLDNAKRLPPSHISRWTKERADAALGSHVVAKRAAQNDELWRKYKTLRERGVMVTPGILKQIIRVDATRSRLYPNITELTHRHQEERATKLPLTRVDPRGEPPKWFIENLSKKGEFDKLIGKLTMLVQDRVD